MAFQLRGSRDTLRSKPGQVIWLCSLPEDIWKVTREAAELIELLIFHSLIFVWPLFFILNERFCVNYRDFDL